MDQAEWELPLVGDSWQYGEGRGLMGSKSYLLLKGTTTPLAVTSKQWPIWGAPTWPPQGAQYTTEIPHFEDTKAFEILMRPIRPWWEMYCPTPRGTSSPTSEAGAVRGPPPNVYTGGGPEHSGQGIG